MKIEFDKYYTPVDLAKMLIEKTFEVIGKDNITDIIEPSAGDGSFSNQLDCRAIDIKPGNDNIEQGDYLSMKIPYKKGRLVIGNPPYGEKLKLAMDFYKKSTEISDYIAFVLPISQLNNTVSMKKFELIYSEDLGKKYYSGRNLWCCFNIYRRRFDDNIKQNKLQIDGITFYRQDKKDYDKITDYDIRMCYWGNGTVGKILTNTDEKYSGEYKIKIDHLKKDEIINFIKTFDWKSYVGGIAMKRLKQYQIVQALLDNIDGLIVKKNKHVQKKQEYFENSNHLF